jgi:hypothetical protein
MRHEKRLEFDNLTPSIPVGCAGDWNLNEGFIKRPLNDHRLKVTYGI